MRTLIVALCLVVHLDASLTNVSLDRHVPDCSYLRPYQVVLSSKDEFLCLGNLISFRNVLTCCQCFIQLEPFDEEAKILIDRPYSVRENIVVKAGFHCSDQFEQYRQGESYAFDPDCKHERGVWEHDAAIMTLGHPFHSNPYVAPINYKFGEYDAERLHWTMDPKNFEGVKCYVEGLWFSKHNGTNYTRSVKYPVQYAKCPVANEYNLCAFHQHRLKGFCFEKNFGSALICKGLVVGYMTNINCSVNEVKMTFHKISFLNHLIWAALQEPGSVQYSNAMMILSHTSFSLLCVLIIHIVRTSKK